MNSITEKRANVYPNFRETSIQYFNDKDKTKKSWILEMTKENLERCEEGNKQDYWIFFSVNPMEKGKRNKESVKGIQTWICDIDTWDKQKQIQLINDAPLQPSLVVESWHGFHLYYLAKDFITAEQYENWNFGLCNYYGWDSKVCKDTARVLRIPWYYHNKGEPFMVEFREDLSSNNCYDYEEITKAFPQQIDTSKLNKQPVNITSNTDSFRGRASQLNSKMMLEELNWSGFMWGDIITFHRNWDGTEQIYVNGKSTSSWIDNNWLIGSYDNGWPTRIQWISWYKTPDFKALAQELKRRHPELEVKQDRPKAEIKEASVKIKRLQRPDFSWGEAWIDNQIGKLRKWQFVILAWETGAWKTTFATFMARNNPKSCYYVLEDSFENIASRYAIKRAWITKEELNNWSWSEYKENAYNKAYERYAGQGVKFIDVGWKIVVEDLMQSMLEYKAKGYEMFFIDNLGFILGDWESEAIMTADVSKKLLSFCINEKVCIVLIHHFKKAQWLFEREISDLRWSGKLGDDAFTIVYYTRDWENEVTKLEVKKDREWGDIKKYEIGYNMWDFYFIKDLNY